VAAMKSSAIMRILMRLRLTREGFCYRLLKRKLESGNGSSLN
jgi:hypothetical protein